MNNRKICLITGASGGIGYEFARLFAQDSYNLILIARTEDKLHKIAAELEEKYNIYVKIIVKDLALPSAPDEIFQETEKEGLVINTLVNNAGFGAKGFFLDLDLGRQLEMIQVNITTLTHLTYLYAKQMTSNGGGKIINVASMAAFQPGPLMSVYYASKSYVLSFSEALTNEFQKSNITVTALCPGPTDTDFFDQPEMGGVQSTMGSKFIVLSAEDAAKEGYNASKAKRSVVIPGLQNKVAAFGTRFLPRALTAKIARMLQEKRRH